MNTEPTNPTDLAIYRRRVVRLMGVLKSHGWHTIAEAVAAHDKGFDPATIKNVGPVLAKVMRGLIAEMGATE